MSFKIDQYRVYRAREGPAVYFCDTIGCTYQTDQQSNISRHLRYSLPDDHVMFEPDLVELRHRTSYIPNQLKGTGIQVDRASLFAVCHFTRMVLLKSEIPRHLSWCPVCHKRDSDIQRIRDHGDEDPRFSRINDDPKLLEALFRNSHGFPRFIVGTENLTYSSSRIKKCLKCASAQTATDISSANRIFVLESKGAHALKWHQNEPPFKLVPAAVSSFRREGDSLLELPKHQLPYVIDEDIPLYEKKRFAAELEREREQERKQHQNLNRIVPDSEDEEDEEYEEQEEEEEEEVEDQDMDGYQDTDREMDQSDYESSEQTASIAPTRSRRRHVIYSPEPSDHSDNSSSEFSSDDANKKRSSDRFETPLSTPVSNPELETNAKGLVQVDAIPEAARWRLVIELYLMEVVPLRLDYRTRPGPSVYIDRPLLIKTLLTHVSILYSERRNDYSSIRPEISSALTQFVRDSAKVGLGTAQLLQKERLSFQNISTVVTSVLDSNAISVAVARLHEIMLALLKEPRVHPIHAHEGTAFKLLVHDITSHLDRPERATVLVDNMLQFWSCVEHAVMSMAQEKTRPDFSGFFVPFVGLRGALAGSRNSTQLPVVGLNGECVQSYGTQIQSSLVPSFVRSVVLTIVRLIDSVTHQCQREAVLKEAANGTINMGHVVELMEELKQQRMSPLDQALFLTSTPEKKLNDLQYDRLLCHLGTCDLLLTLLLTLVVCCTGASALGLDALVNIRYKGPLRMVFDTRSERLKIAGPGSRIRTVLPAAVTELLLRYNYFVKPTLVRQLSRFKVSPATWQRLETRVFYGLHERDWTPAQCCYRMTGLIFEHSGLLITPYGWQAVAEVLTADGKVMDEMMAYLTRQWGKTLVPPDKPEHEPRPTNGDAHTSPRTM